MPRIEFWYDLASTYSYLAAMRIEALAAEAGVDLAWRPFLLGPIFKAQGWNTSPFSLYPAKGRAMLCDMRRTCDERALPFQMPAQFPAHSLLAMRVAHLGEPEGWCPDFTKAAFLAEFGEGKNIADTAVLGALLSGIGLDGEDVLNRAGGDSVKESMRARTAAAQSLGIFGAPTFITGKKELFWGDDRLEQSLRWATKPL